MTVQVPLNHPAILQAIEKGLIAAPAVKPATPKRAVREVAIATTARWCVTLYPACRVVTEANTHESPWRKVKRAKTQREAVYLAWCASPLCGPEAWAHLTGVVVTLTHVGPTFDDDNLATAFKAVRDEVAKLIGVDDGSSFYQWRYEQHRGKPAIEIRIESRATS